MLKLEELEVYKLAMEVGEEVWKIVEGWNYFSKRTIGEQLTRAADSISANISEGYGRFHFKENKQFCYYGRGSLMETKTFLMKAKNRNLIPEKEFDETFEKLQTIHLKLNAYIKSIGKRI